MATPPFSSPPSVDDHLPEDVLAGRCRPSDLHHPRGRGGPGNGGNAQLSTSLAAVNAAPPPSLTLSLQLAAFLSRSIF